MVTWKDNVVSGGFDVHYKSSQVTFSNARSWVEARCVLDHRDREKLREQLADWPQGIPVVLEASFGWGWLSDELRGAGFDVHLSNCFKVERMRELRGWSKTNKKDADLLSQLPLEPSKWWEVWRASKEVRDARELMRHRGDLVALQTQLKNRIHANFHRNGIFHEYSDLFGSQGRQFLNQLCREGHEHLSRNAHYALKNDVEILGEVRKRLAGIDRQLRAPQENDEILGYLRTIPGIGQILCQVLKAEIGEIERFRREDNLASYCLLAPRAKDTGPEDPTKAPKGRHVGRRGNRTLKWAFIEAAHGAVRKGGRYRAIFDYYTQGGKKDRNRGYIKIARELVRAVHAVWRKGEPYREVLPGRHAKPKRTKRSRSGTG
jgi:transposase